MVYVIEEYHYTIRAGFSYWFRERKICKAYLVLCFSLIPSDTNGENEF
jgi:hypothetical protein